MSRARRARNDLRAGLTEAQHELHCAMEMTRAVRVFAGSGVDKFSEQELESRLRAGRLLRDLADHTARAYEQLREVDAAANRQRRAPGVRRAAHAIGRSADGLDRSGFGRLAVLARAHQRSQHLSELTPANRVEIRYKPDGKDLEALEVELEATLREVERLLQLSVLSA